MSGLNTPIGAKLVTPEGFINSAWNEFFVRLLASAGITGDLGDLEAKVSGMEANATADQTPAEILTAVKTVDGTGSGLDADLLDGVEYAAILAAINAKEDAHSHTETFTYTLCDTATDLIVGTEIIGYAVPAVMNGMNLTAATLVAHTAGTSATVGIKRRRGTTDVNMLSTGITLGSGNSSSNGVVDTSNDDLATGDWVFIDTTAVGATAPKGVSITLVFSET